MLITLPPPALVVLVGPSGAGKSTFARRHFAPTEILSSDALRAWVCDDASSQAATADAFDLLHRIAALRLKRGLLAVIDATNLQEHARRRLLTLARRHQAHPVAVAFALPEPLCQQRNRDRPDRTVPPRVVHDHCRQLTHALRRLHHTFPSVHILRSTDAVDAVAFSRLPPPKPPPPALENPPDPPPAVLGCAPNTGPHPKNGATAQKPAPAPLNTTTPYPTTTPPPPQGSNP